MKILCTGYKGYIGSEVFFRLKLMGLNPIGFDKGDKLRKADVIIHLAANLYGEGENYIKKEFDLAKEVCSKTNKIVFTSSAAVYGDCDTPCKEGQKLEPINDYGRVKKMIEDFLHYEYTGRFSILRLANVYSKEADHGFIAKLLKGERVLYSEGSRSRDYVHLHDVANVIIEAALTNKWDLVYNIGTGKSITAKELYERLGKRKPIFGWKKEIGHSCLDISSAEKNGFKPFTI